LLEGIDATVKVRGPIDVPIDLPDRFRNYLINHSTGRQLALIMSLPQSGPALYVDADVRFFPGASDLLDVVTTGQAPAYFQADCQFAGDERLLRDDAEKQLPVNTGVLLLLKPLDWSLAIGRFLELQTEPAFHTNQTLTHLTMHRNGARPLDPWKYVLQLDDQTELRDRHASARIALRHYVQPVRHKFWTSLIH
jgi:hypothetical protein